MTYTPFNGTNGTYHTLGRDFRTPAHPDVLTALGRALFNFLNLEEYIPGIIYIATGEGLSETRGKTAHRKEQALTNLARRYEAAGLPEIADDLRTAVQAFSVAREEIRNRLLHAHPYTSGSDSEGAYLPGLAHTFKDGDRWITLSETPEELLDLATGIEKALSPLSTAYVRVIGRPLHTATDVEHTDPGAYDE